MNLPDWKLVYKVDPLATDALVPTNLIYTPLTHENIMCMNFNHTHHYQHEMVKPTLPERPDYTEELVSYLFNRELNYIEKFKGKSWAPTYIEIDKDQQKIFFEWSGESCNRILFSGRALEELCPNWQEQLEMIVLDLLRDGYYKLTLYPHCFFVQDGILKTFDFYACADIADPYIELETIKGIIGKRSIGRFAAATEGSKINTRILFEQAVTTYSGWPGNPLKKILEGKSKIILN